MSSAFPCRWIKRFELVSEFLEYVLRSNASAVTMIICSTKQTFIPKLSASIQLQSQNQESSSELQEGGTDSVDTPQSPSHSLVSRTIGTIAMSQRVTLAYCPSVEHLRAQLSIYTSPKQDGIPPENVPYQGRPMIAIVDPLAVHAHSSELSAQGLSRTLALAVEVAAREDADVVLCESGAVGTEHADTGNGLWDVDIPLLTPSLGATSREGTRGTHGTVKAKRIAKRWFDFDREQVAAHRTREHSIS